MEINIISQIGQCVEFMAEGAKKKEAVSIVISPIKIVNREGESDLRVINGCNLWQGCHNKQCHFSAAGRKLPRVGVR